MSDGPLDKMMDKFESFLDATIPKGKLGIAAMSHTSADGKVVHVWHFAHYKRGLVCEPDTMVPNASYHETVPKGGQFLFCRYCLVKAVDALRE